MSTWIVVGLPVGLSVAAAAFAFAGSPTYTDAWKGVWEVTERTIDCETLEVIEEDVSFLALCPGDPVLGSEDGCSGSVTDESYEADCLWSIPVKDDCEAVFSYEASGTRSGDTYTGTTYYVVFYSGEGCELSEGLCISTEVEAVRTEDEPDCGRTPVDATSWGTLKMRFE